MFAVRHLSQTSASDECHAGAQRHDLSVMTLRASVATCPALACSLLVTAPPCVIGWHTFSASVWNFTHKHIFLFLVVDIPAHRRIHHGKGSFLLHISRPSSMPSPRVVLFLLFSDMQEHSAVFEPLSLEFLWAPLWSHFPW